MPLKLSPVYDTIDAIPEPVREHYSEVDGKYMFTKEIEVETTQEVAGLRSALDKVKRKEKELVESLGKFKDIDPDEYAKAREELEALRAAKSGSKEEMDRAIAAVESRLRTEITKKDERIGKLATRLQNREKDTAINAALQKYEATDAGAAKALQRLVRDMTNVVEEDDEYVVHVVDDSGKVRYGKRGEPMTVAELVEEMATSGDFKSMFKGTGASGGGAEGSLKGQRIIGGRRVVSREYAQANYRAMKAEADKQGKAVPDLFVIED